MTTSIRQDQSDICTFSVKYLTKDQRRYPYITEPYMVYISTDDISMSHRCFNFLYISIVISNFR